MLRELRVQHFALIDDLRIAFGPRLNALTGETGAGKSILIDAVTMVLGGRASADFVRSGHEEAVVEASFDVEPGSPAADALATMGYPPDDELVIQRVVAANGKGRVYANGRPVTVAMLSQVTTHLIDLHSQHEYQSLLRVETPLLVLDVFARADALRREVRGAWAEWTDATAAASSRAANEAARAREVALLEHEVEELDQAAPGPNERFALERERALLRNAERIRQALHAASGRLDGPTGDVLDGASLIARELKAVGALEPRLAEAAELAENAVVQLQELQGALRRCGWDDERADERLDALEARLAELQRLRRKYDVEDDALCALADEKRARLTALRDEVAMGHTLDERIATSRRRLVALATQLHERRLDASERLAVLVNEELARLRMSARIQLDVLPLDDEGTIGQSGRDRVELTIRTNVGEPAKPLRKIASGGELSRIMLGIKSALAGVDPVPTLIFDEADAGVGGAVAEVVGRRLRAIADHRQVLCVTHLPQVASGADTHILVEKSVEEGRTSTRARRVTGRDRVREVARMLAGEAVTTTAIRHAEELIRLVSAPVEVDATPAPSRGRQAGRAGATHVPS